MSDELDTEDFDEDLDSGGGDPLDPPEYVNLPDGRALVVRGSGAGSIIEGQVEEALVVSAIRSRDEALAGAVPLFMCQSGHNYFDREPEVLAALHADHGDWVALGQVVRIPRSTPAIVRRRLDVPSVSVRVADPMGYIAFPDRLVIDPDLPKPTHLTNAPYLGDLRGPASAYAAGLLDAQRSAGANLLLTSGRAVAVAQIGDSFDEIADEADELFTRPARSFMIGARLVGTR